MVGSVEGAAYWLTSDHFLQAEHGFSGYLWGLETIQSCCVFCQRFCTLDDVLLPGAYTTAGPGVTTIRNMIRTLAREGRDMHSGCVGSRQTVISFWLYGSSRGSWAHTETCCYPIRGRPRWLVMLSLEASLSASVRHPCYCSNLDRIWPRVNSCRPSCWSCRTVMPPVPRPLSAQEEDKTRKAWTRNRLICIQTRDLSSLMFPPMPTSPRISMRQKNAWPARLFVFVPTTTSP